jgi:hypothetical protein
MRLSSRTGVPSERAAAIGRVARRRRRFVVDRCWHGREGALTRALADASRSYARRWVVACPRYSPASTPAPVPAPRDCRPDDLFGPSRGHLLARRECGAIVIVDIGLGDHAGLADGAPALVDESWVARCIPSIYPNAHKGTRRRVVIVGGSRGMAGAVILAARAASRSLSG